MIASSHYSFDFLEKMGGSNQAGVRFYNQKGGVRVPRQKKRKEGEEKGRKSAFVFYTFYLHLIIGVTSAEATNPPSSSLLNALHYITYLEECGKTFSDIVTIIKRFAPLPFQTL